MGNYYLYRLGQFLAAVFPFWLSRVLVMGLCDLHYCFSRADRRAVEKNLKIAWQTDLVSWRQVRGVFRNFGQYLLEFFTLKKILNPRFVQSRVRIDHPEYLDEVVKKGRGAILVSAHVGNWEMGGAIMPMLGFPLSVVALAHLDPRVNALFNAQREAFGVQVIQADAAVRRVVEHLKQNRFVAILGDRDFGGGGIPMNFLGRTAMVPKGAAFFSMKTGSPILPIFFMRRPNGDFEINVYPAIDPPPANGKVTDEEARRTMQQYIKPMEDEIRKDPCQWLMFRELGAS